MWMNRFLLVANLTPSEFVGNNFDKRIELFRKCPKPDLAFRGSMWRFKEFADFMTKIKNKDQSTLDHLYRYANKLNQTDDFEGDFTIVEVSFS